MLWIAPFTWTETLAESRSALGGMDYLTLNSGPNGGTRLSWPHRGETKSDEPLAQRAPQRLPIEEEKRTR